MLHFLSYLFPTILEWPFFVEFSVIVLSMVFDTTLDSKYDWTTDLREQLEWACELESDLGDTMD